MHQRAVPLANTGGCGGVHVSYLCMWVGATSPCLQVLEMDERTFDSTYSALLTKRGLNRWGRGRVGRRARTAAAA